MGMFVAHSRYVDQCVGKWDVANQVRKSVSSLIKEARMSTGLNVAVYDRPVDQVGAVLDSNNGQSIVFQVPVDHDSDGDFLDNFGRIEWGADNNLDWSIEYCWDSTTEEVLRRIWDSGNTLRENIVMANDISAFRIRGYNYSTSSHSYVISANLEMAEIDVTAVKTELRGRTLPTPFRLTLNNQVVWRN